MGILIDIVIFLVCFRVLAKAVCILMLAWQDTFPPRAKGWPSKRDTNDNEI